MFMDGKRRSTIYFHPTCDTPRLERPAGRDGPTEAKPSDPTIIVRRLPNQVNKPYHSCHETKQCSAAQTVIRVQVVYYLAVTQHQLVPVSLKTVTTQIIS